MVWVLQLNDGTLNPFLQHPSATFVKELVEVESGGKALFNRSVLQETMDLCCSTNSTLPGGKTFHQEECWDVALVLILLGRSSANFSPAER